MSKFNNKKTIVDGIKFDSKLEASYYVLLKGLEAEGKVSDIELQPRFVLLESFVDSAGTKHRKTEYVSDFRYFDRVVDGWIVVEVKGRETEVFRVKEKLFLFKFPEVNYQKIFKI